MGPIEALKTLEELEDAFVSIVVLSKLEVKSFFIKLLLLVMVALVVFV